MRIENGEAINLPINFANVLYLQKHP